MAHNKHYVKRIIRFVHSNYDCRTWIHCPWRSTAFSTPVHRSTSILTEPFSAQARPKQAMHVTSIITSVIFHRGGECSRVCVCMTHVAMHKFCKRYRDISISDSGRLAKYSARWCKLAAIAIYMIKVSIASTRWGLFSDTWFLLKGWSVPDLRADYCFSIHFSIELKLHLQGVYSTNLIVSRLKWKRIS